MLCEASDELASQTHSVGGQPDNSDAPVMDGGPACDEPALRELIDDAGEIRRVDAAALRELLERGRVPRLEPPHQLRLCVGQLERLQARPLVVERPSEQVHQPLDDLLLRSLGGHYRYLTAFLDSGSLRATAWRPSGSAGSG